MTLDLLHLTDPAVAHADDFKDDPSFSCFDVRMSTLTHVQAKDGQPLTLSGLTGRMEAKDVLVSGSPSRINMIDCQAINLLPADERLLVQGLGNGKQEALINATRCFDVELSGLDGGTSRFQRKSDI